MPSLEQREEPKMRWLLSGGRKKAWPVAIGLACFFFVLCLAILLLLLALGLGPKDCSEDGFNNLFFLKRTGDRVYYKFVVTDEEFNFEDSAKKCEELNATLWEPELEQLEWNELSKQLKKSNGDRNKIWIGGKKAENCPAGPATICKEEEASKGQGLRVNWLSGGYYRDFSRLRGGADSECVLIDEAEENQERLWTSINCQEKWPALCIKRNCKRPDEFS